MNSGEGPAALTGRLTPALVRLDTEYARFNSAKTISDPRASRFATREFGPLIVTSDPARDDAYYNRVLGLSEPALPWLDEALGSLGDAVSIRADVVAPMDRNAKAALASRGFAPQGRVSWLTAPTGPRVGSEKAVRLSRGDRDRLLPLLELDGPVDPDAWALRSQFYCTETFRVFAIEEDGGLVSMASTFVGENGAILGNAVTHPDHRCRGHHSELLQSRLADAKRLGLEWVVTDVEPQGVSVRNCERAGFRKLFDQDVWSRGRESGR